MPNNIDLELRLLTEKVKVLTGELGEKNENRRALLYGEAKDLREFIAGLRTKSTDIQKQLDQAEADLDVLEEGLAQAQGDIDEANQAITAANTRIGELQGEVDDIDQALIVANQSLTDITTNVTALQTALGTAQEDLDNIAGGVTSAQQSIDKIKTQVAAVVLPTLESNAITGTVTAAQYNRVVSDLYGLLGAITDLKTAITT